MKRINEDAPTNHTSANIAGTNNDVTWKKIKTVVRRRKMKTFNEFVELIESVSKSVHHELINNLKKSINDDSHVKEVHGEHYGGPASKSTGIHKDRYITKRFGRKTILHYGRFDAHKGTSSDNRHKYNTEKMHELKHIAIKHGFKSTEHGHVLEHPETKSKLILHKPSQKFYTDRHTGYDLYTPNHKE